MSTSHPRHQVTETTEVAAALDHAAEHWPGEPRSKLLLRLLRQGAAALERDGEEAVFQRQRAVRASSGAYADAFGPDYLRDLREDWPG